MTTTTKNLGGAARASWVVFTETPMETSARHPAEVVASDLQKPVPASAETFSSVEPMALPPPQNVWVLFDEKLCPAPAPDAQVKGARHSVCSTASFWSDIPQSEESSTSQSEQSSVSVGVSPCGLALRSMEEPSFGTMSLPPSPSSSDGLDMDSISRVSNNKHGNSQSETGFASRFNTWVTFENDKEHPHLHGIPADPHTQLDNAHHTTLQHSSRNFIGLPLLNQNSSNSGTERQLLNLTPVGSGVIGIDPLVQNSTPYTKKNPFFDEEFNHIQPSPVNPFSSYFDGRREVDSKQECMSEMKSNGIHHHMGAYSELSSTNFHNPSLQAKQESILLFPKFEIPVEEGQAEGRCKTIPVSPPTDKLDLDHLRNVKISDPDDPGCFSLPDDPLQEEEEVEEVEVSYQPEHMAAREGWPMLLRIPEKKNIMSSRHWGPIYVRMSEEGLLQLYYEQGMEKPFRTVPLDPRQEVSEHRLQSYEETSQVHTLSVDLVQYREKRRIKSKSPVVHQPIREQMIKLGTTSYFDYLSFRHSLAELLRRLPLSASVATLPGPITAAGSGVSEDEVQVEVQDEFYGTVGEGDGRILKHLVTTRVHVLAFVSGSPGCRLGLNDIQVKGKEVVWRHDVIPSTTTRWIRLRACELHPDHADQPEFLSSRAVTFTPPSCQRFELLRFHTAFAEKTLPFTLRTAVSVCGAEVTLQSWLLMSQGFSSNRDALNIIPCENVSVRYPIPEIWAKNFKREGIMGEKSLKARFNKGASFGTSSTSGSEPVMRVTLGTAKYEQAFKAVVWRINRLPDKNYAMRHPHTFYCCLELGSDQEVPKYWHHHLEVEFDMPAASASKATIRSLSVGERSDVKKWITYKSHFFYQVPIERKKDDITDNSQSQDQLGDCVQQ